MLKLKMMLCVMMLPSSSVAHQSIRQSVREATTPPAWIMHRLADTAERDYFTLREADHYAKTTGREPRSILMIGEIDAYTMGNSCNYCEQYTPRFPAEYKCLK